MAFVILMVSWRFQKVIGNNVFKGRKGLDWSPHHVLTTTKANLECSIIYKMAVSLYTNTRPREIKNEDRREAKRVLVFTPQSQKCYKSRHKCRIFDSISDNGKVLKTWRVSWICSEEWRVTTENSATMASGHFYESICMARYQEPPSPDLQPWVYVLIWRTKSKCVIIVRMKCRAFTEHVNVMLASCCCTISEQSSTILSRLKVCSGASQRY